MNLHKTQKWWPISFKLFLAITVMSLFTSTSKATLFPDKGSQNIDISYEFGWHVDDPTPSSNPGHHHSDVVYVANSASQNLHRYSTNGVPVAVTPSLHWNLGPPNGTTSSGDALSINFNPFFDYGNTFVSNQFKMNLLSVTGPGNYLIYKPIGSGDSSAFLMDSGDGISASDSVTFSTRGDNPSLQHIFTAPGTYTIQFEFSGVLQNSGTTTSSGPVDFRFVVIPRDGSIEDGFDRPDDSDLGPMWIKALGDFSISNETLAGSANEFSLAILSGGVHNHVSTEAHVHISGSGTEFAGLIAHAQNNGFYWATLLFSGGHYYAALYRYSSGAFSLLAYQEVSSGDGFLRLDISGTALSLFWNDHRLVGANDLLGPVSGSCGVFGRGGSYDRFVVVDAPRSIPLDDDFSWYDRPEGNSLGYPWNIVAGNFSVVGGPWIVSNPPNHISGAPNQVSLAVIQDISKADVVLTSYVDVLSSSSDLAGLTARVTNQGFYWGFVSNSGYIGLYRYHSGVLTLLDARAIPGAFTGKGKLQLELIGSSLKLSWFNEDTISDSINYSQILFVTDSTLPSAGLFGILGVGSTYDDFTVMNPWP
jgi:surface-anchored protein